MTAMSRLPLAAGWRRLTRRGARPTVAAVSEPGPASSSRAWWAAVAVAVAAAAPFWQCPLVPTQDGPAHLYNAWLVLHVDDPALGAIPVRSRAALTWILEASWSVMTPG